MLVPKVSFSHNQKSKSQSSFKSKATQQILTSTAKELGFSQAAREATMTRSEIPLRNVFDRALDVFQEEGSKLTNVERRGPFKSYMDPNVEINHLGFKHEGETIGVNSLYNSKTQKTSFEYTETTTNGKGDAFVDAITYSFTPGNKKAYVKKASGDLSLVTI